MKYEQLKLSNQFCFPVYAASRLITRAYQPLLENLGITYPQYLVLMILWENDHVSVNEIAQQLILNTNTVTPLLKRMEKIGLISRKRSETDERKMIVSLSNKGIKLREEAAVIPEKLAKKMDVETFTMDDIIDLRDKLNRLIRAIRD